MTATARKVKATESTTAKKSRQAPALAQAKKPTQARKVAKAKNAAPVGKVAQVEAPDQVAMVAETVAQKVMPIPQAGTADSPDRILLPARMELSCLDEAHQLLQSKYPPVHAKYIIDGALLNVIDMAGIQMLISFIRSVTAKGSKVEWDNYSVQVYQLASELGVTSQLGD